MTLEQQKNAAKAFVTLYAQPTVFPELSDEEIEAILVQVQQARIWEASTAYEFGDIVLPTVKNGRRFVCAQAGTSGVTEPKWTTFHQGLTSDGAALIWQEAGPDWANVYDKVRAVHLAWTLKASKASSLYDLKKGGLEDHRFSLIHEQCTQEAKKWAPIQVA